MKELFDQMPRLLDLTLEKVNQIESMSDRPETKEARNTLIQSIRQASQELAKLSEKFGQEPKPATKQRTPAVLAPKKEEAKQLSFDFGDGY